jgi:hypothetical protein
LAGVKEVDRLLPAQGAATGRSAHRNHGVSSPAALLSRSIFKAHWRQRSAIRLQVILLSGSRVNRAILLALIGVPQKFFLGFIAGHFQQLGGIDMLHVPYRS